MDELLDIVAQQKGYPAELVRRAAEARAKAAGVSTEEIVRSWAGGEAGSVPVSAPAPEPAAPAPPAAPAETPVPDEAAGPQVEVLEPVAASAEPTDELVDVAAPEPVPAGAGFPRWLAVAFIVLPTIALLYALVAPAGPDCGSSGFLAIDPATGEAENCDGSVYGAEAGPFALGESIYVGQCATCHGPTGGGGTGPAMANGAVLATFSACTEHIEWVLLGSNAWPTSTYGDNATPVLGTGVAMPGFPNLTPEELAAVVIYERVAFGGETIVDAEAGCAAGEDEVTASGE